MSRSTFRLPGFTRSGQQANGVLLGSSTLSGPLGHLLLHPDGSIFLVSFANFSSIGIIAGAVKALNEEKGNVVACFGLRLLYGATLVSILNATIVGLII